MDDLIHSRPRLLIMLTLYAFEKCTFKFLKEKLGFSDGVLSVHLQKLEQAGYVKVKKTFMNRRPLTSYSITEKGRKALVEYVSQMRDLFREYGL